MSDRRKSGTGGGWGPFPPNTPVAHGTGRQEALPTDADGEPDRNAARCAHCGLPTPDPQANGGTCRLCGRTTTGDGLYD